MEKIFVFDNFLTENELDTAISIINSKKWSCNHRSLGKELYETPFWSMDLNDESHFSIHIKNIIEKTMKKKFKLQRVYANGNTFGQDGSFHRDSDKKNSYTFCIYFTNIHSDFIETAGGHIFFKFKNLKYNICYEPIFNRGIFFPSNYLHKGTSFSRYIMDMRICVSWKLEEEI